LPDDTGSVYGGKGFGEQDWGKAESQKSQEDQIQDQNKPICATSSQV
jgi:hypothetical protein